MAHTIVIFGASGDLTSRKLIPALYRLHQKQRLPPDTQIVGVSRSSFSDEQWREQLQQSTQKYARDTYTPDSWALFSQTVHYHPGDINAPEDFRSLAARLGVLEHAKQKVERLYYLSTAPQLYETAIANLGLADLAREEHGRRRIVIEKPFGTDLQTARQLNNAIHRVFKEDQIYRIDHYLGKETVQNLMVFRFANAIFEPIWNRNFVDHVQITVAEEVTVGRRGGYYDQSGILRDMFQNHLLQLMMITAMEPPARYDANLVRDEKVKVLLSTRPKVGGDYAADSVRGQYEGYRQEEGVPTGSDTETFAALRLYIDNWRWKGVPFYLRSGKAMSCRTTQIVIQFREPPHLLFSSGKTRTFEANRLVIQVQPAEGIQLHFQTKVPDTEMKTRMGELDFRFQPTDGGELPDAYQRLLLDALIGDASLFARSDEVELAWGIIDPILAAWRSPAAPPLQYYSPGGWGPEWSTDWMRQQGREWFDVCPVLR
jgi:glucose-6-phosphate 1-dehydrogenase